MGDLAEKFVSSSYDFSKRLTLTGGLKRRLDEVMANYRILMMKARKFRLDDDFVELSSRASVIGPEEALARVQSAILPYDVVWIEYNPRVKVAASIAMSEKPDRKVDDRVLDIAGLLLVRDEKNTNAFSIQLVGEAEIKSRSGNVSKLYVVHPMAALFDGEGRGDINNATIAGTVAWEKFTDAKGIAFEGMTAKDLSASVWGYVSKAHANTGNIAEQFNGLSYFVPEYLTKHAAIAYSDAFAVLMREIGDYGNPGSILDQFATDIAENAGLTRWIVTILSMLAEVPIIVGDPKRSETARIRTGTGSIKPGFEKSLVTLNLPRVKNRVRYVARKIAGGGRKKRHEVQSHWRTYQTDVGPMCIHAWTYSEDLDHRRCEVCGTFSTKIRNHLRGDESLGWATRETRVTARKKEMER